VTIENRTPYAAIHNEGGTISVPVTAKMKRFAWAKYYEASGRKRTKDGKTHKRRKPLSPQESEAAEAWKRLALTKKTSLRITIPRRQFMGNSLELRQKLQEMIEKELMNIMNG
jgi:phage gpG-like protein